MNNWIQENKKYIQYPNLVEAKDRPMDSRLFFLEFITA